MDPDDPDNPDNSSDIELLERWRCDDTRAGQVLFRRYYHQIRKFFVNAVDDDARQDLTQETFRKLVQSRDKFEGRSSFRTFLFGIARHTLLDHLKRTYRGKGKFIPLEHSVLDHGGVRPSRAIAEVERHQALLGCIRALPIETKQLLELYYWQDLTARELGEIHDLNEKTISSRLASARKRLIECLRGQPTPNEDEDGGGDLEAQLRELGQFFESGPLASTTDPDELQ